MMMCRKIVVLLLFAMAVGTGEVQAQKFLNNLKKKVEQITNEAKQKQKQQQQQRQQQPQRPAQQQPQRQNPPQRPGQSQQSKSQSQPTAMKPKFIALPATTTALLEPLGTPTENGVYSAAFTLPQGSESSQRAWVNAQPAIEKLTNKRLLDEANTLGDWINKASGSLAEAVVMRHYNLTQEVTRRVKALNDMAKRLGDARNTSHTQSLREMYMSQLAETLKSDEYKRTIKSSIEPLRPHMRQSLVEYFDKNGGTATAHSAVKTKWQPVETEYVDTADGVRGVLLENGNIDVGGLIFRIFPTQKRAVLERAEASRLKGKDVVIPDHIKVNGFNYPVDEIKPGVFYSTAMKSVVIPNTVKRIGNNAFANMIYVTRIDIPESVVELEAAVFHSSPELREVHVPESVKRIGGGCFADCPKLTTVTLPREVKHFDTGQFQECHALTTVTLPENLKEIRSGMFNGCSNLTHVVIPASVTRIKSSAFAGCGKLKSIKIPEGVTAIEAWAFSGCVSMTSIVIPKSVTDISGSAFMDCPALKHVTIGSQFKDSQTLFSIFGRRLFDVNNPNSLDNFTFIE